MTTLASHSPDRTFIAESAACGDENSALCYPTTVRDPNFVNINSKIKLISNLSTDVETVQIISYNVKYEKSCSSYFKLCLLYYHFQFSSVGEGVGEVRSQLGPS